MRFPSLALAGALTLSVGLFLVLAWSSLASFRRHTSLQQHYLRFEQLRGLVLQWDEVLTSSAELAAFSGERRWEERYRRFEPQLDQAIKELETLEQQIALTRHSIQIDEANARLVRMENQAFSLVGQGRLAQACGVLTNAAYAEQKQLYQEGLNSLMTEASRCFQDNVMNERRRLQRNLLACLTGLGLTAWIWGLVIRSLVRWRRALLLAQDHSRRAEEALRQERGQLETQVKERTAALHLEIAERQRTEAAVRESEEKFRSLFDMSKDAIMVSDPEHFVDCNQAAVEMFGFASKEEILNKSPTELCPPKQADGQDTKVALRARVTAACAQGHELFDCLHQRKDGSVFEAEVLLNRIELNGRLAIQGVVRDISGRKRVERQTHALALLAHDLSMAPTAKAAAQAVTRVADEFFGWDACIVQLCSLARASGFELLVMDTVEGRRVELAADPADRSLTEFTRKVLTEGAQLISRQPGATAALPLKRFGDHARLSASLMCAPIRLGEQAIGALSFQSYTAKAYDGSALKTLQALADHCAGALHRLQTQETLHESEERFRQLAENIGQVFWLTRLDTGALLYVSPAFEEVWGMPRQRVYQDPQAWFVAVHPEDRPRVQKAASMLPQTQVQAEYRIVRPDGSVRWIRNATFPIKNDQGRIYRVAGVAEDITERKGAEQTLRLLNSAVEQSSEAVMITEAGPDPLDVKIIFVNNAFARIRGYAPEEVIGKTTGMLRRPDRDRAETERIRQTLQRGESYHGEIPVYREDGTELELEWLITPLRDADNVITHFLCTQRDITPRKRAEQVLRASEERYRRLIEESPDMIFAACEGRIAYINPTGLRLLGAATADQVVGQEVFKFIHPDYHAVVAQRTASGHLSPPLAEKYLRLDGSAIDVEVTAMPMTVGDKPGAQVIVRDISERKRAEEAQARLATILEGTPDFAGYARASDLRVLYLNAGGRRLAGLGLQEEVSHLTIADFTTAQEQQRFQAEVMPKVLQTGSWTGEGILQSRAGEEIPMLMTLLAHRSLAGRVEAISALGRDIREIRRVRHELAESEKHYRELFNAINDAVMITDFQGRILQVNATCCEQLGRAQAELAGMTVQQIDSPGYAARVSERMKALEAAGKALFESAHVRADGAVIPIEVSVRLVEYRGQPALLSVVRDITERKQAEAKMAALHRQLLETSRQAGMAEVATSVLHNVGNVLNSLNVTTSLLGDKYRNSKIPNLVKAAALLEEHRSDLAHFLAEDSRGKEFSPYLSALAQRLAREHSEIQDELAVLQEDVTHIKEIVAMQQNYARVVGLVEPFSLNDLLEDALRINEAAMDRHEIEVVRQWGDLPPVHSEKHKVLQILVNLISNAKYAMQGCGRAKRLILRTETPAPGRVRLSVTDNGVGIATEKKDRIFQLGYTTRKSGHGFGLHNGAVIAQELGGSLTMESPGAGQGATFRLELPVSRAKDAP